MDILDPKVKSQIWDPHGSLSLKVGEEPSLTEASMLLLSTYLLTHSRTQKQDSGF